MKKIPYSLDKKIKSSIKLLQSIPDKNQIELCYSGGKDSDIILHLAKMAGINYRAIYRCTTIDPKGTIKHCIDNGVEIFHPKKTFFQLIEEKGLPSRFVRYCCAYLKEYKILDTSIMGIRRCESIKRAKMYHEPQICRFYGSKKEHVNVFLPILDWDDNDVETFINYMGIRCHPLYYNEEERFCVKKRLGCIGCPLKSDKGKKDFMENPKFLKLYLKHFERYWNSHPNIKLRQYFANHFENFIYHLFFNSINEFNMFKYNLFGEIDGKKLLENYFRIEL